MTLAILVALDITVLTMKSKNVVLFIISIYVYIFAYKIFRFNSFMNEMKALATAFKKNPEKE
jgi:hypothetical protein